MKNVIDQTKRHDSNRDGASPIEYGLLIALMFVVIFSAVSMKETTLKSSFETMSRTSVAAAR